MSQLRIRIRLFLNLGRMQPASVHVLARKGTDMLRIVEVHSSERPGGEYLVLQNVGTVTVCLRGWALCTDAYLEGDPAAIAGQMYVFRDDVGIRPYTRIVLFTGFGENAWVPTIDGHQAYCAYWNRTERIWTDANNVHVLQLHATRPIPKAESLAPAMCAS
jgi:hypothetical protein